MENGTEKGAGVLHLYGTVLVAGPADGRAHSAQQPGVTAAPSSSVPPLPQGWALRYGAGAERCRESCGLWETHGHGAGVDGSRGRDPCAAAALRDWRRAELIELSAAVIPMC